ncbi:phage holin family protein [Caldimonas brevitalea]|uniref:Phage holin family protein n=1 Tax=Caldimonas brevitalea TaxID=413882 RepID=A0A0G3BVQ7_9BURK|nr:phage holin family protein [Caldimonas brevitalea]AKJ30615.1 hypothetical protein AAW51_3924 [Caldimonas brevitalea]
MTFSQAAGSLWHELRGSLQERAKLFSLEAQRTGLTLVQMVLYAVVAAVLVVTSWLGLMGGIAAWLVLSADVHWGVALLVVVALNLVAAGLLAWYMRGLVRRLGFPATIRQLKSSQQQKPPSHTPAQTLH